MRSPEFLLLLFESPIPYVVIMVVVFLLFIPFFKHFSRSVIDPMFFLLLNTAFAYIIPFYLYYNKFCSESHLLYFILSESIFWLIMIYRSKKDCHFKRYRIVDEEKMAAFIFKIVFINFIFCSLFTYIYIGIPLFLNSRQELYVDAEAGSGLLGRLSGFAQAYVVLYIYHRMLTYKEKKYGWLLVLVVINCFLSASKGSILVLVTWYFFYVFFYMKKAIKIKIKYVISLLLFPVVVLMNYAGSDNTDFGSGIIGFLYRFIANGDTYWNSYPNNTIDAIHYKTPIITLLAGILGPFRLVPYDMIENSVGNQIFWEVEPQAEGVIEGPNARLAVMGWIFFRWYGLLFSAIMAWICSALIYKVKKFLPDSFFGLFIYGELYLIAIIIPTDPALSFNQLGTLIMNILLYGVILIVVTGFKIEHKRYARTK